MSTYLAGNTEVLITNNQWIQVLRLACMYGWQPAGTEAPEFWDNPDFGFNQDGSRREWYCPWPWNYRLNDCQRVTDDDAQAMGAALQNALDDIPECAGLPADWTVIVEDSPVTQAIRQTFGDVVIEGHDAEMNPLEFFGGNRKDVILRIVELCQAGFMIA